MKIKFVSEDDLYLVKSNLKTVYTGMFINGVNLQSSLNADGIIRESAVEIDEFKMDQSQPIESAFLTDAENVKRVYNHMKVLSDSQASDERIWVAYSLGYFFDYMKYRWPANSAQDLNNRYLFGYSVQRSLFRNGVSRLWWIGRVTYDEKESNPYYLAEYLCKNQDYIENICGRNIFNSPNVMKAVIKAIYDSENNGVPVNRELVRELCKHLNLIAGTYIIDMFDKDEIYEMVCNKLKKLAEEPTVEMQEL